MNMDYGYFADVKFKYKCVYKGDMTKQEMPIEGMTKECKELGSFQTIKEMVKILFPNTTSTEIKKYVNQVRVGNLAQLLPVIGSQVFKSSVWKLFYPLFLRQPHRQQEQSEIYDMLQNIRLGN
ncbi:hypothetical protein C1645_838601 [Glomus cerebriforme]|uniref:Uncharacterized protein n=1 Tax=Glomus cerebriforme TaxID=658196 RepID=A0A397SCN5_9GLOM|nr:hypothetical protein C1645_838601 [Glomus cerebriforme]